MQPMGPGGVMNGQSRLAALQALGSGVSQMGPGRGSAVNGMGLGLQQQQPQPQQQQTQQPPQGGMGDLSMGLGGAMGSSFGGGGGRSMLGVPDQLPFDMSEFPVLANRMGNMSLVESDTTHMQRAYSAGLTSDGNQGGLPRGNAPQEFAIQNEDFPALPGTQPPPSQPLLKHNLAPMGRGVLGQPQGEEGNRAVGGNTTSGLGGLVGATEDGKGGQALGGQGQSKSAEQYGLLGLLNVIRMSDPDLNTLALGSDLTTLGLNLNASESLYTTFASPWAEGPATREPKFFLPSCYNMQKQVLKLTHFSKFQLETLLYIFYAMPKDALQAYAAEELYRREWRYHKEMKLWIKEESTGFNKVQFWYFDINLWERRPFPNTTGTLPALAAGSVTLVDLKKR